MKASIYPYTNDPINQGDLIAATDVTELRTNTTKLLQDFHAHIGSTVNKKGSDGDKSVQQHGVASTSSAGFAPYSVYDLITDYENKYNELKNKIIGDLYPELSIVIWGGTYNDTLPDGWVFCDGTSVLYEDPETGEQTLAPDLRYTIPVSVSTDSYFLDRKVGAERILTDSSKSYLRTGVTKYYIIKKPTTPVVTDLVYLVVVQPNNPGITAGADKARIATQYTEHTDAELNALEDGNVRSVPLPRGTEIIVSARDGSDYEIKDFYIKKESASSEEKLSKNSFYLEENTVVRASTYYNKSQLSVIQPVGARIGTPYTTNTEEELMKLPDGNVETVPVLTGTTVTATTYDTTKYKLNKLWTRPTGSTTKTYITNKQFTLTQSTDLGADVDNKKALLTITSPEDVEISTPYTIFSTSAMVNIGDTVTVTITDGKKWKHINWWIKVDNGEKQYMSGNSFVMTSNTEVGADVTLVPYTFKIEKTTNQDITVVCGGTTHKGSRLNDVTFTAYYDQYWYATISADNGYIAGTLSQTSDTITGDKTIYASPAIQLDYNFIIKATKHQLVTVTCAGVAHTSTTKDTVFTCHYGEKWSVAITPDTNYYQGTIKPSATSGTIVGDYTLKVTYAIPKTLTCSVTKSRGVDDNSYNGCLLLGEEFELEESQTVKISIAYDFSGGASTDWGWCWSGYCFVVLPEAKYTLSTGKKMNAGVWDEYSPGYNSGGTIGYDSNTLKTHPWADFSSGSGARGNFGGKGFAAHTVTSGNYHNYSDSATITLPAGNSHVAIIYNISASYGDGASFTSVKIGDGTYTVKATITLT